MPATMQALVVLEPNRFEIQEVECAGVPVTVGWALGMLRRGGRCAAVGIPTLGVEIAMQKLVLDELELALGSRATAGEMRRVMPLVEPGPDAGAVGHDPPVRRSPTTARPSPRSTTPASGAIKIIIVP